MSTLGDFLTFKNGSTSPERSDMYPYPVFGSNGIIGFSSNVNVETEAIVIGRVGSYCGSVFYSKTPAHVTDNAMFAVPKSDGNTRYWYYYLKYLNLHQLRHGSGQPLLNQSILKQIEISPQPTEVQLEISTLLGLLDDKIESNRRQRTLARQLGLAMVARIEKIATAYSPLENFALSISRGVTPKYYKEEDVEPSLVLNQRCIRDGWVSPKAARLMLPRAKAKNAGIAEQGDLLVNSTGQGTLGRVGRWSHEEALYVDSHVSVVKPDLTKIAPTLLSYLVFPRQSQIEDMAEGSTGQTELSPTRLGSLELPVIPQDEQDIIEQKLLILEEKAHAAAAEIEKLEAMRDALLPELLTGRMRISALGVGK